MKLRECFLVEFLFESGFGVWCVVQGFFQTDKKKNVAAEKKQRNLNLCGLINFHGEYNTCRRRKQYADEDVGKIMLLEYM